MTKTNNDIPIYAEEIIIEQPTAQQIIQEILNKFRQPVPDKFVELKVEEGNYQFSTNPNWKDKVPCERYGFYKKQDNSEKKEWIQIDIPHTLLENLEIPKGEDITYPLYLDPQVLEKFLKGEHIRGAITIENEEEIFIDKPVSEKGAKRQLFKRLEELKGLRKKVKELEQDKQTSRETIDTLTNERDARPVITLQQYQNLNAQLNTANTQKLTSAEQNAITWINLCLTALNNALANSNVSYLDSYQSYFNPSGVFSLSVVGGLTKYGRMYNAVNSLVNAWNQVRTQINTRKALITNYQSQINNLNSQLTNVKSELQKEQGWWDNWFNDDENNLWYSFRLEQLSEYGISTLSKATNTHEWIGNYGQDDKTFICSLKGEIYKSYRESEKVYNVNSEKVTFNLDLRNPAGWPGQPYKAGEIKKFIKTIYMYYRCREKVQ